MLTSPVDLSAHLAQPTGAELAARRLFAPGAPLVICDIGACEGEDSVRYARLFPRARIFAFEPLPANQALVRANLARYAVTQAELEPLALSDRAGEATFHVSSGRPPALFAGANWNYGNKSSSLLAPAGAGPMHGWLEFKETITVPTDTLDAFCARRGLTRIDFIQMDVQGAEQLVLRGATRMLPRITAVWLEVSRKENYRGQPLDTELARFMHAHGFALAQSLYLENDTGEGDHLYVNLRHARVWPFLAACRLTAWLGAARARIGRLRRALRA